MFFKYLKTSDVAANADSSRIDEQISAELASAGRPTYHIGMTSTQYMSMIQMEERVESAIHKEHRALNKMDEELEKRAEARRARIFKWSTKLHLYKFIISECALNTNSHGLTNIARLDSKLLRILWAVCFLASVGYCTYSCVIIVMNFLQYDVLVNQEVVYKAPVDFPAVVSLFECNQQKIKIHVSSIIFLR